MVVPKRTITHQAQYVKSLKLEEEKKTYSAIFTINGRQAKVIFYIRHTKKELPAIHTISIKGLRKNLRISFNLRDAIRREVESIKFRKELAKLEGNVDE